MYDNFKTPNVKFPLCCLWLNNNYEKLLSYCIYSYSLFLKSKNKSTKYDKEMVIELSDDIENYVDENEIEDYETYDPHHSFLILAGIKMDINFSSIKELVEGYSEINAKIEQYERVHGKDVFVKIHKDILFDAIDKKIDKRFFNIYCAIKAVVGSKDFKRITVERIKYAMCGFKLKRAYDIEVKNLSGKHKNSNCFKMNIPPLLTDRQIKTTLNKLRVRKLIAFYTNKNRFTYYATKPNLRGEKFMIKLAKYLGIMKFKQDQIKVENIIMKDLIDKEYNNAIKQFKNKMTAKSEGDCKPKSNHSNLLDVKKCVNLNDTF